jgi:hypothetical protein
LSEPLNFPLFRKYPNNKSFFKITDEDRFEELKRTGPLKDHFEFKAKIHPDRVFIQDMIEMTNGFWVESSAEEWELENA